MQVESRKSELIEQNKNHPYRNSVIATQFHVRGMGECRAQNY